ncbi:cupin domain-containing protein [Alphaproteobacteria bacterium]|nr:cupin domain-containing protein [Alphaproteobacteria bacterium]
MDDSDKIIEQLKMNPHPEGGYYSESFRDKDNSVSLIYYLLKKGQRSHWHRLTKNEILHFYKGDPLSVHISDYAETIITKKLGNDIVNNENIHLVIRAGSWFSMNTEGNYSLIGCTVSPAFEYADFELAPPNWEPKK